MPLKCLRENRKARKEEKELWEEQAAVRGELSTTMDSAGEREKEDRTIEQAVWEQTVVHDVQIVDAEGR
eukprot:m.339729 g.339729  ORF g.339729 m.339729 type:complete len:69 (-) comp16096_c0_seq15:3171-3377(-)